MQIELSEAAAAAVQKWLDAGGFDDAAHVVEYAVLTMREPADFEAGELQRLVEEALAAGDANGWHPAEDIMPKAREIVARAEARNRRSA